MAAVGRCGVCEAASGARSRESSRTRPHGWPLVSLGRGILILPDPVASFSLFSLPEADFSSVVPSLVFSVISLSAIFHLFFYSPGRMSLQSRFCAFRQRAGSVFHSCLLASTYFCTHVPHIHPRTPAVCSSQGLPLIAHVGGRLTGR